MEGHNVAELWREAWQPQEDLEPMDWLLANVERIPYSPLGRLVEEGEVPMRPILNAMADPRVKIVALSMCVQSCKTLCLYAYIAWKVANKPAPTLVTMPTEKQIWDASMMRIRPLLDNTKTVKDLIPRGIEKDKAKKSSILFNNGMPLWMLPANKSSLQSNTIESVLMDECWMLRDTSEFRPIADAYARITRFFTGKLILASQGSTAGDPFDQAWCETDMRSLHFTCPECGTQQPYSWDCIEWETYKDEAGAYQFNDIAETVQMRCCNDDCGHRFSDDPQERRDLIATAEFVATNPNASSNRVGFRVNAICNQSWAMLVEEYLKAKQALQLGDSVLMRTWTQKRMGEMWSEDLSGDFEIEVCAGEETCDEAAEWEGEARFRLERKGKTLKPVILPEGSEAINSFRCRSLTIDVQKLGLWCLVESWGHHNQSKRLFAAYVETWEEAEELQKKYEVHPMLVAADIGDQGMVVLEQCLKRGWMGIRGDKKEAFPWKDEDGNTILRAYSRNQPRQLGKARVRTHNVSTLMLKDRLARMLQQPNLYTLPADILPVIHDHLASEIRGKGRAGQPLWIPKKSTSEDHLRDCCVYGLALQDMLGLFTMETEDVDGESPNDGER